MKGGAAWRRAAAPGAAAAAAAGLVLLAACGGSGSDDAIAPVPTAAGAHAYLEPTAALRPGHVAIVRLGPVASDASSGAEDGLRRIRLHLDAPGRYAVAVDADAERVQRIVVRDGTGAELGRHERGAVAASVDLPAGTHMLEVHHANRGDATAPVQTVFVRLAAAGANLGADPTAITAIRAGANCLSCDLSNADLSGLRLGQGQDVSGSDFSGSNLNGANWLEVDRPVVARRANFSTNAASGRPTVLTAALDNVDLSGSNFTNADLSRTGIVFAKLDGANLSGATVGGPLTVLGVTTASLAGVTVSATTVFQAFSRGQPGTATNLSNVVFPAGFPGLKGRDLRYVNFSGASFAGVDLGGADFTDANLAGVNFANARLTGALPATLFASIRPTDVTGVDFNGFDLSRADFSRTVVSATTRFAGAKLSDGAGAAINLAGLALPPLATTLRGLDLGGANLDGATLAQSDLQGTNFSNAQLHGANVDYANLKGARLNGAQLGVEPGGGARKATLIGAYMPNVDFTDADLRSADLTGAHLYGTAQLLRTRFDGANFSGANLAGAAFSGSLTGAVFNNASLVNATFSGADLTNASLDSALLQGADFSAAARLAGVSLADALVAVSAGNWSFTEANGMPFVFPYRATALGTIATGPATDGVVCPNGGQGPCTPGTLTPLNGGPFPPRPKCVPLPPNYDNCPPPTP